MPFVELARRKLLNENQIPENELTPGDRCYRHYRKMVERWKFTPRWTTAHEIFRDLIESQDAPEESLAAALAWQVFFNLYVIPYEIKKREENGDI